MSDNKPAAPAGRKISHAELIGYLTAGAALLSGIAALVAAASGQ